MKGYWTPSIKFQMTYCNNDLIDVGALIPSDTIGSEIFQDMSGSVVKVLIVLVTHMSSTEYTCYPTFELIAAETGLSKPSVNSCIKQLVSMGIIAKVEQRKSRNNPQYKHNIYYLNKEFIEVITVELIDFSEQKIKKYFNTDDAEHETNYDEFPDVLEEAG